MKTNNESSSPETIETASETQALPKLRLSKDTLRVLSVRTSLQTGAPNPCPLSTPTRACCTAATSNH